MWGDVRSPEGCRDGTLCAVEAELDRDGRADCMCLLRVIAGSQQQQAPSRSDGGVTAPSLHKGAGWPQIHPKSRGNERTRATTDFTTHPQRADC